jgi:hypothetical protein
MASLEIDHDETLCAAVAGKMILPGSIRLA